jgi:hypothetical protein
MMKASSQKVARGWGMICSLARSRIVRPARVLGAVAMLLGAMVLPAGAEQVDYSKFDHLTTGFPLDGRHLNLRCEQCHLNGVFEGTPRQCQLCHVQGNTRSAVFQPANHIPTTALATMSADCSSCHTTNTFEGAHFAHSNVTPGTCAQCHNNINAVGKNPGHVATSAPCDQCHTTVSFAAAFTAFPVGHIPTSQTCSLCHSNGYSITLTQMVHSGITGGCTTCHAADAPATAPITFTMQAVQTWPAPPLTVQFTPTSQNYHLPTPASPTHFTINESCDVCHTTPATPMPVTAAAGGFAGGKMNHTGISSGCANCHADGSGPFIGVTGLVLQSTKGPHIPTSGTACELCHKSTQTPGGFAGTTMVHSGLNNLSSCSSCHENNTTDIAYYGITTKMVVRPPISAPQPDAVTPIDANHPASGECTQCHSSTTTFTANIVVPSNHIPVGSTACANCHAGQPAPYSPAGTTMNHTGFTSSCNGCHGSGKSFYGTAQTEAGGQPMQPPNIGAAGGHIPIGSADCVSCHSASSTLAGGFKLSATGAAVMGTAGHNAVSSVSCSSCHGYGSTWLGVPTTVVPGGANGGSPGSSQHIPLGSGDCITCHANASPTFATGAFRITATPALGTAGHGAVNGVACATCHAATVATAGGWQGLATPTPLVTTPSGHLPFGSGSCGGCHGSNFVTNGFVMPNKGAVPPTANPVMSVASHAVALAALGNTCNQCHDGVVNPSALTFYGVGGNISLRPGSAVPGLSSNPHDAQHPTTGDCVNCHSTSPPFSATANALPGNHIPLASQSTCATSCHKGGYAATTTAIDHTDAAISGEACSACHGASVASGFFGTGLGSGGQPVPPATVAPLHIPIGSVDCKTCHTAAPPNGLVSTMTGTATASAAFRIATTPLLSAAGHAAVASLSGGCNACHASGSGTPGPGPIAWQGSPSTVGPGTGAIGTSGNHIQLGTGNCNTCHASNFVVGGFKIATAPALAAAGHAAVASLSCNTCHAPASTTWLGVTAVTSAANHIPQSTAVCSGCHASNFVTGGFKITTTPVMSVASHTAVSGLTCNSCHENNATDLGFQGVLSQIYLRPGNAVAGLSPVDANHATGTLATPNDCKSCHTTTPPFQGSAGSKPSNHIPSSSVCTNCHTGYAPATTGMNHADSGVGTAGSPTACATCHGYGTSFTGTAQGGCTATSCTGGQPLQPPGVLNGPASASQHIPFNGQPCSMCHTSTTVPGGFKGTTVPHTNGPFMTYTRGKGQSNTGTSTPRCVTCHAPKGASWYGTKQSTETMGSHAGSSASADCIDCHSATGGFAAAAAAAARAKPRPTSGLTKRPAGGPAASATGPAAAPATGPAAAPATGPASRATPPGATPRPMAGPGALIGTGPFSHAGVAPGSCTRCHRAGGSATAMPGGHLPTTLSCDACHRTTAWVPAAFTHARVGPGHCASCHAAAGKWATPKPANHFVTARSCDLCHHTTNTWLPVMYDHLSPRYRPLQTSAVRCIDCHTNNTEMVVPGLSKPSRLKAVPGGPGRIP